MGEDDHTEVYVIPKTDFSVWLLKQNGVSREEENVHGETSKIGKKDM